MIEIKAPNPIVGHYNSLRRIFLAGSIEMGVAEKWQDRICKDLNDFDILLLNPRRDDWDSSWTQEASDPQFSKQVNWEQDQMLEADIVVFYFDPQTKSPITLLELGLSLARDYLHQNILVCCPDGYWRKGNVDIVCKRAGITVLNSYSELVDNLRQIALEMEQC